MASARARRIRRHRRNARKTQERANSLQHEVTTASGRASEVEQMIEGARKKYHTT